MQDENVEDKMRENGRISSFHAETAALILVHVLSLFSSLQSME